MKLNVERTDEGFFKLWGAALQIALGHRLVGGQTRSLGGLWQSNQPVTGPALYLPFYWWKISFGGGVMQSPEQLENKIPKEERQIVGFEVKEAA